ncbi:MAG: hypothetical protein CM15mV37_0610 [uncultured marine virus]|nr:MAG: hypothetical protein CM15mV37_0610 [uncultured marine virus]
MKEFLSRWLTKTLVQSDIDAAGFIDAEAAAIAYQFRQPLYPLWVICRCNVLGKVRGIQLNWKILCSFGESKK